MIHLPTRHGYTLINDKHPLFKRYRINLNKIGSYIVHKLWAKVTPDGKFFLMIERYSNEAKQTKFHTYQLVTNN